jgi:hypothetical protein
VETRKRKKKEGKEKESSPYMMCEDSIFPLQ